MGDDSPGSSLHASRSSMAPFSLPASLGSARGWLSSWLVWQAHWEQWVRESDAPEEPIVPGLASGMLAE